MRKRDGFTIVELLTVMALIGVLVGIAIPHYQGMKKRAIAASIFADVHAIRIAAMSYYTETGKFPADAGVGQVPPEMVSHLPQGFSFTRPDYLYDWQVWSAGATKDLIGVGIQASDADVIKHLYKAGGAEFIPIQTTSRLTFLLSED